MYRTHIPIFGRQFVAEWCKPTWGQKKSITKTAEYNGKAPQNSYIVLRSLDGARPWHAKWKAPVVSSAGAELTAARAATSFANKCCFSCVPSVFLYMLHSEPQRSTLSWPTHTHPQRSVRKEHFIWSSWTEPCRVAQIQPRQAENASSEECGIPGEPGSCVTTEDWICVPLM